LNPLYRLDQEAFRALHLGIQRDWLDPIMVVITDTGRGEVKFTALALLCFNKHIRPFALMALSSSIFAGLFGQLVKTFIKRDRPSNFSWAEPITTYIEVLSGQSAPAASNSFPSGHAVSSFAIAVAIALAVRKTEHAWVGRALLVWATLVAVSRVYVGVHFPTDVIGGAAIGTVFGTLAYMLWKKKGWLTELDRLEPAE
jgi:membrane-associated phospholipid phosphatase